MDQKISGTALKLKAKKIWKETQIELKFMKPLKYIISIWIFNQI